MRRFPPRFRDGSGACCGKRGRLTLFKCTLRPKPRWNPSWVNHTWPPCHLSSQGGRGGRLPALTKESLRTPCRAHQTRKYHLQFLPRHRAVGTPLLGMICNGQPSRQHSEHQGPTNPSVRGTLAAHRQVYQCQRGPLRRPTRQMPLARNVLRHRLPSKCPRQARPATLSNRPPSQWLNLTPWDNGLTTSDRRPGFSQRRIVRGGSRPRSAW